MCLITLLESQGSRESSYREMPKKNTLGILAELQHVQQDAEDYQKKFYCFLFSCMAWVCGNQLHHSEDPQSWDERIYLQTNIECLSSKLRCHKGKTSPEGCLNPSAYASTGQGPLPTDNTAVGRCPRIKEKEEGGNLDFHFFKLEMISLPRRSPWNWLDLSESVRGKINTLPAFSWKGWLEIKIKISYRKRKLLFTQMII